MRQRRNLMQARRSAGIITKEQADILNKKSNLRLVKEYTEEEKNADIDVLKYGRLGELPVADAVKMTKSPDIVEDTLNSLIKVSDKYYNALRLLGRGEIARQNLRRQTIRQLENAKAVLDKHKNIMPKDLFEKYEFTFREVYEALSIDKHEVGNKYTIPDQISNEDDKTKTAKSYNKTVHMDKNFVNNRYQQNSIPTKPTLSTSGYIPTGLVIGEEVSSALGSGAANANIKPPEQKEETNTDKAKNAEFLKQALSGTQSPTGQPPTLSQPSSTQQNIPSTQNQNKINDWLGSLDDQELQKVLSTMDSLGM